MEKNNEKINETVEVFKKTFNTEEKLQKHFRGMGDLISRYVLEVAENEKPDEQFVKQVINANFAYELFDDKKTTRTGYNQKKLNPSSSEIDDLSIRTVLNENTEYNEPEFTEYLENFLYSDAPPAPQKDLENPDALKDLQENEQYKQYYRAQTAIHEFNHTGCYTKQIYIDTNNKRSNSMPKNSQERKNGTIIRYVGGLPTKIFKFDDKGKELTIVARTSYDRLHEGITEYLTHKQIQGDKFDDYMIGNKSLKECEAYYGATSYYEAYLFASMAENLFDNALTKSYRGSYRNNKVINKNLNEIAELYYPLGTAINALHNYKVLDKTKAVRDVPEYKNLLEAINSVSSNIKATADKKLKTREISQEKYDDTIKSLKKFTLGNTLEFSLGRNCQLSFIDTSEVFKQLKQDLGDTQLKLFNKKYYTIKEISRDA